MSLLQPAPNLGRSGLYLPKLPSLSTRLIYGVPAPLYPLPVCILNLSQSYRTPHSSRPTALGPGSVFLQTIPHELQESPLVSPFQSHAAHYLLVQNGMFSQTLPEFFSTAILLESDSEKTLDNVQASHFKLEIKGVVQLVNALTHAACKQPLQNSRRYSTMIPKNLSELRQSASEIRGT